MINLQSSWGVSASFLQVLVQTRSTTERTIAARSKSPLQKISCIFGHPVVLDQRAPRETVTGLRPTPLGDKRKAAPCGPPLTYG